MPDLHNDILTDKQNKLLPLIAEFSDDFGLVGGTAIAFHIGHRKSIDFDMFSEEKFGNQSILNKIKNLIPENSNKIIVNKLDELTLIIDGVKITFFHYPYKITYPVSFGYRIKIPDLLTLSAMKAFALGHRAKWKDYVDLYFILKGGFSISQISQKGREIFGGEFNEKLFRSQLSYFDKINYEETIEFMPGFEVSDDIIKNQLIEFSLT